LKGLGVEQRFAQKTEATPVARLLEAIAPAYDRTVPICTLLTFVVFLLALVRFDFAVLGPTTVAFAFCAMHALILMSVDRYAFPPYLIAIGALCAVVARWFTWVSAWRRVDTVPPEQADQGFVRSGT
jgi:hypothetical protein